MKSLALSSLGWITASVEHFRLCNHVSFHVAVGTDKSHILTSELQRLLRQSPNFDKK